MKDNTLKTKKLSRELLHKIDAYWRAANYVSVGQIYLYNNPLLKKPLDLSDVKPLLVGHWGTTTEQNFIYVHLNRVIKEYDKDKHIIFAFHGYPWLIHRLTYRRTNDFLHVRGYKEEGSVTTAFDMRVQNNLDRFSLVQDVIDRLPQLGSKGSYLKQMMQDNLIKHKNYINKHGKDMEEILNWKWEG